jgi:hypothetical protein
MGWIPICIKYFQLIDPVKCFPGLNTVIGKQKNNPKERCFFSGFINMALTYCASFYVYFIEVTNKSCFV